ncbi:MAG: hypothetical protein C0595_06425, partial [Marinilabiliales bacterium]
NCDFSTITVAPNEFTCEDLGPQAVTITGVAAGQVGSSNTFIPTSVTTLEGQDMVSGDFNQDGNKDIYVNRGWHKNNLNSFTQYVNLGSPVTGMQVGDLDGDGDLDMISEKYVYHWNGSNFVYKQTFAENNPAFGSTSLADFDGDGDLDFYCQTYYGEPDRIYFNDGNGIFTLGKSFAISSYQISSSPGDFDGDGDVDIVIAGYYNVYVGFNDGNANMTYTSIFTNGGSYIRDVKARDFNGDGKLDIAFVGVANGGLTIMFGNGDGTFQSAQLIDAYYFSWDMDVNDFEGDGDLDIVSLVHGQNAKLYINDGSGNFTSTELNFQGSYNNICTVLMDDFNNDGICDFAIRSKVIMGEFISGEETVTSSTVTVTDPNSVCNAAPEALAQDITISVDGNCEANAVAADVDNGSFDPDGEEITMTISPAGPYAIGSTEVTLTVTDGQLSSTATATITVVDDTAPVITTSGSPITLWPPNHQYATVSVSDFVESVSDNCSGVDANDVVVTSVSSDEAENANGNGDGNTLNDIVIADNCKSVNLRKERSGNGNGRVYTINVELTDAAGNTATASFNVHVPKNKNGNAIDDGAEYTVESACGGEKSSEAFINDVVKNSMKVYPNPTLGNASLEVDLDMSANTNIEMYNSYGKKVAVIFNGYMESGRTNKLNIQGGDLPKGIYYIRLISGKSTSEMVKLIITG